jgi:hypothetical protein
MASPTISYIALDLSYDPIFDSQSSLVDTYAVAQAILTRLNLFYGEWWENLTLGLPVFQSMLGQLETQRSLQAMQLLVQQQIESLAPLVTAIVDLNASFNGGAFTFTCTVQTVFGQVTVSNVPGINASLG